MLSVVMFEEMNRSEQESLFRTSRTLSLVPANSRVRHHSHGNIRLPTEASSVKIFPDNRNSSYSDDLVLSVLKSPLNHIEKDIETCRPSPGSEDELVENANEDSTKYKNSEDELETDAAERVPFLQRLRGHRTPRFGEAHHKRVPTPLKRKHKHDRKKSHDATDDVVDEEVEDEPTEDTPRGVPDPYYPIYLPIDQAFKAKYVFHHKKGKTFQERLYVFLEHPGGWICFVYHFTV